MEITASAELPAKFQRLSRAFKIICVSLIPVFYLMCFRKGKWGSGIPLQKRCDQVRHVLTWSAASLNAPGTRAEGTATGTKALVLKPAPAISLCHWSQPTKKDGTILGLGLCQTAQTEDLRLVLAPPYPPGEQWWCWIPELGSHRPVPHSAVTHCLRFLRPQLQEKVA